MPTWSAVNLSSAIERVSSETRDYYKPGARVAVKLHMGERGGKYYLAPEMTKQFIDALKANGYRPFLFDTPVMYPGGRNTVRKYYQTATSHGYTDEQIGCPVVISDESVPVVIAEFEYGVAAELTRSDGLFVLTHVKGHECTGVGGAIKNLGMGGVSKRTKKAMHTLSKPQLIGECADCKKCEQVCPDKSIMIFGRRVKIRGICTGCDICVNNCPVRALAPRNRRIEAFIAQAALAVVKSVPAVYGINVMKNIVKHCDCYTGDLPMICPDIGFIGGPDIAALDERSIDLINQKLGRDIFRELWHKSAKVQIKEYRTASQSASATISRGN